MTNKPLLIAALLMAVTFLVHVFAGGADLYVPLRASDLSSIETSSFSVIWHFVSVQLFLLAVVLFRLASDRNQALFAFAFVSIVSFAVLFIGYGIVDLGSIWLMPQWIAFAVTAVLMIWGWLRP